MSQPTKKDAKKKKTKSVHFHLAHGTIDYLKSKVDEGERSIPDAGRRIIEAKQREDEKRRAGG